MKAQAAAFQLEVEGTSAVCPVGERYAQEQLSAGTIPVLSCEGPCIRGEIARQVAHRVAREAPFARACQGEVLAVPRSGMARWVRESEQVVVVDGCFLRCQGRMLRRMLQPEQLVEIDALSLYHKYTDIFAIDDVSEAERIEVAEEVARQVLARLAGSGATEGSQSWSQTATAAAAEKRT
ncbi:MAG TPA: putative zinc-binding protein [Longimicrobiales bacterium]|nr:putative zinc-binding protein [Longimicrobiales bacterium]